jgi:outer membrane protein assembly factor BamD (BamD/ComL family)
MIHRRCRSVRGLALLCCFALASLGCKSSGSSLGESPPSKLEKRQVPHAIELAEANLAAGDSQRALQWMTSAAAVPDLPTETRNHVQDLEEKAADARIRQLSVPGTDPKDLEDMLDLELPRQLAVTAGIRAAQLQFAAGNAKDAYYLIKRVDTKFPLHHERVAAGDLLVDIGLYLSEHPSHFLWVFTSHDDAEEVLEYAILNDPWSSRCDEANATLARLYEDDREWRQAIDRNEKLVLNFPQSRFRSYAQARVPHLRLRALKTPEYDRNELLLARKELEDWLNRYAGNELEPAVRADLADGLRRLAESDLLIARFYRKVDSQAGVRLHAERAVEEAKLAGDEARVLAARELLSKLPEDALRAGGEPAKEPKP